MRWSEAFAIALFGMRFSGLKTAVLLAASFAIVFVAFGGWLDGYSLPSVVFLALTGLMLGAVAAPLLEPKAFRHPTLWQVCCASAACVLVAGLLEADADGYLLAIALGIVLGYLAPVWIKYVTGP